MRKSLSKIVLATFGLALAFTFSCSSEDDNNSVDPPNINSGISSSSDKSSSSGRSSSSFGSSSSSLSSSSSSSSSRSSSSSFSSSSSNNSSSSVVVGSNVVYGDSVIYEGETYQTVVIGTQTWFQRNLNYNVEGSKCYDNETANCAVYGRLYNWETANNVCPSGWHLPSAEDWGELMRYVDGSTGTSSPSSSPCPYSSPTAGRYLKATSGWNGLNGEDTFGFSALPGGLYSSYISKFKEVSVMGYWWSASESNSYNGYHSDMVSKGDHMYCETYAKGSLLSVRCLKD